MKLNHLFSSCYNTLPCIGYKTSDKVWNSRKALKARFGGLVMEGEKKNSPPGMGKERELAGQDASCMSIGVQPFLVSGPSSFPTHRSGPVFHTAWLIAAFQLMGDSLDHKQAKAITVWLLQSYFNLVLFLFLFRTSAFWIIFTPIFRNLGHVLMTGHPGHY